MKAIGQILLLASGAILMLHSLLPHDHHDELDDLQHYEQRASAESLVDYIKLAFHIDLGEDHLEDFQGSKQLDFSITPIDPVNVILPKPEILMIRDQYHEEGAVVISRASVAAIPFRGPPSA